MSGLSSRHSYKGEISTAFGKAPLVFRWCALVILLACASPLYTSVSAQKGRKPGPISPRPKADARKPEPAPNINQGQTVRQLSPEELAKIPKPGDGPLRVTVELNVDAANKVKGFVQVSLNSPAATSVSAYVILPFRITSITPADGHLLASHTIVADRFSVLAIIASPQTAPESKIQFEVSPLLHEPTKPFMSEDEANYLVLQKSEGGLYTLLFHYDQTQILQVDSLAKFTDAMTVPTKFVIVMPEETDIRRHENKIRPEKRIGRGQVFVVGSELFGSKVFVNYAPANTSMDVSIIYVVAGTLAALGLIVIAFSDDTLSRRAKIRINWVFVALTLALMIFCVAISGISSLRNNLNTLIPAAGSCLLNVFVLIFNFVKPRPAPQPAQQPAPPPNQNP